MVWVAHGIWAVDTDIIKSQGNSLLKQKKKRKPGVQNMPIDKTSGLFKWVAKTMSPRNRAAGEAFWKVIKTCCAVFIFQPWFCFLCAPLSCPEARQAPGESSPKHTRAKKRGLMMLLDEPHTQKIPSRCWGHFGGLVGGFRDIFEEILGLFFFFSGNFGVF